MKSIMLIELWEQLCGYDKWVETEAKIESSEVRKDPVDYIVPPMRTSGSGYVRVVGDVLTWVDNHGERQYATFDVTPDSKLGQLLDGESVTIRYDPAHPDCFYYRDLLRYRVNVAVWSAVGAVLAAAFFIAIFWVGVVKGR
jgi:hypothetical protein